MATVSLTFKIDGIDEEHGYELPCPTCKRSTIDAVSGVPGDVDCPTCDGYGGPAELPEPRFELNVANAHGAELLQRLGIPGDCTGSVDPRDVLTALAMRPGVSERERRYDVVLSRIATMAVRYGRHVVWH